MFVDPGGGYRARNVSHSRSLRRPSTSFLPDSHSCEPVEDFADDIAPSLPQPTPVYLPGKATFPCASVGSGF